MCSSWGKKKKKIPHQTNPPTHLDDDALTPVLLLKATGEEIHKGLHRER